MACADSLWIWRPIRGMLDSIAAAAVIWTESSSGVPRSATSHLMRHWPRANPLDHPHRPDSPELWRRVLPAGVSYARHFAGHDPPDRLAAVVTGRIRQQAALAGYRQTTDKQDCAASGFQSNDG
jgi:hypothetical protein